MWVHAGRTRRVGVDRSPLRTKAVAVFVAGLLAFAVAACGTADDEIGVARPLDLAFFGEEQASSSPRDPVYISWGDVGPLAPGSYRSRIFRPLITFTVGEGWLLRQHQPELITLARSEGAEHVGPALRFINLEGGHAGADPATSPRTDHPETMAPLPADLGGWLATLPYLNTGAIAPVEAAKGAGVTFTFTVGDLPTDPLCVPRGDCVSVFVMRNGLEPGFTEGDAGRIWLFETQPGPLYVQAFGPDEPTAEGFLTEATEVVESARLG